MNPPSKHLKTEPFSHHERSRIILTVIRNGTWEGTRFGIPVKLRIDRTLISNVTASCCFRHHWVRFSTETVAEALDECNRMILRGGKG